MKMTLQNVKAIFRDAKENNDNYVAMWIRMPGCDKAEIIINPKSNFDKKLEYYLKAYNDDLTLKTCNEIRIVGMGRYESLTEFGELEDEENE